MEALCRYALRPPVAQGRLSRAGDGSDNLLLRLKRPLLDRTRELTLTPSALLKRLAALVPRPRRHQIHYFGAFASHARARGCIVRRSPRLGHRCRGDCVSGGQLPLVLPAPRLGGDGEEPAPVVKAPSPRGRELSWAELLKRTFAAEVLQCRCGGRRRVTAYVSDRAKAAEILEELGLKVVEPRLARARGPPQRELFEPSPESFAADPSYADG